jgi:ankyrin repeat protein
VKYKTSLTLRHYSFGHFFDHRFIICIIIISILFLTPLSSFCSTPITKEDAIKALAILHINFDEESFYNAIYNNDVAIVDLFFLAGMSPNTIFTFRDKGKTPLITAIYNNHNDMVKLIIEKGADVNHLYHIKENEERSALYFSIANLNYENSKLLLEKGANTYFIHNNQIYNGKSLLDMMMAKKEYASSGDGKLIPMDAQARATAVKILELLKDHADNDLVTLTGKVSLGPKGWTFEPRDQVSKAEEYGLGADLPEMLKKILEQAKNQNTLVAITGELYGNNYIYITKIKHDEKLYSIPHYPRHK